MKMRCDGVQPVKVSVALGFSARVFFSRMTAVFDLWLA